MVGSNFLDERADISGVGPISVDPQIQGKGAGRLLMGAVLDRVPGAMAVIRYARQHGTKWLWLARIMQRRRSPTKSHAWLGR